MSATKVAHLLWKVDKAVTTTDAQQLHCLTAFELHRFEVLLHKLSALSEHIFFKFSCSRARTLDSFIRPQDSPRSEAGLDGSQGPSNFTNILASSRRRGSDRGVVR